MLSSYLAKIVCIKWLNLSCIIAQLKNNFQTYEGGLKSSRPNNEKTNV
jgi:hypothetical protein